MAKKYSLPYGHQDLEFTLPLDIHLEWIRPPDVAAHPDPLQLIQEALDTPIGHVDRSKLKPDIKVGVAILDSTRPGINPLLLPALLEWFAQVGVGPNQVHLMLASGIHPRPSAEELEKILPREVQGDCHFHFHDAYDASKLSSLGTTERGIPVQINEAFLECEFKVALGVIAPHQFQGYSGGVKAAAIGLAGRETIERNHALMVDPDSRLGVYDTNPARQDTEAIGRMIDLDLVLNLVLNRNDEVIAALAGEPFAVMEVGIPVCHKASCTPVKGKYDLIIASAGGHPRDINLYQAQKGLAHACLISRAGGSVILLAACPQGSGSQGFEDAVADHPSPEQVIARFHEKGFRIGAHKAYQIARDVMERDVYLYSEIEQSAVRRYLLQPIDSVEQALNKLSVNLSSARVGLMPWASQTIPMMVEEGL